MRTPLSETDGEVRELTADDMKLFRPIADVDPQMLAAVAEGRRCGRPRIASPKARMGFRLAADVAAGVRASGRGYNARVEKVLRVALAQGKL